MRCEVLEEIESALVAAGERPEVKAGEVVLIVSDKKTTFDRIGVQWTNANKWYATYVVSKDDLLVEKETKRNANE